MFGVIVENELFNFRVLDFSQELEIVALVSDNLQLLLEEFYAVFLWNVSHFHMVCLLDEVVEGLRLGKSLPERLVILDFHVPFEVKNHV